MTLIFDLHNIRAYRGQHQVFDDLSFTLAKGQHTAILGPNGAGKSTLMGLLDRSLYPVVRPNSHIEIFGESKVHLWSLRARMGFVSPEFHAGFETPATALDTVASAFVGAVGLYDHHSVSESQYAASEQQLDNMGLRHLATTPFLRLSTGEQRRVLLARATVHQPEVLVLDEPTGGLDVHSAFAMLNTLRDLARSGVTLVLVTHFIQEIIPEIERVCLLKQGRMEFDGTKTEALKQDRLSALYDTSLTVEQQGDYFHWTPTG